MWYTLFLLNGSTAARALATEVRASLRQYELDAPPFELKWLTEDEMREVAWENPPALPLPEIVLERVAGAMGIVDQFTSSKSVRRTLAELMDEASRTRRRHVAALMPAESAEPTTPVLDKAVRQYAPVAKYAVVLLATTFFLGALTGSYLAAKSPLPRILGSPPAAVVDETKELKDRLIHIEKRLDALAGSLHADVSE